MSSLWHFFKTVQYLKSYPRHLHLQRHSQHVVSYAGWMVDDWISELAMHPFPGLCGSVWTQSASGHAVKTRKQISEEPILFLFLYINKEHFIFWHKILRFDWGSTSQSMFRSCHDCTFTCVTFTKLDFFFFFIWVLRPTNIMWLTLSQVIVRWGENGRSPRKTTWPSASRTWLVSQVTQWLDLPEFWQLCCNGTRQPSLSPSGQGSNILRF